MLQDLKRHMVSRTSRSRGGPPGGRRDALAAGAAGHVAAPPTEEALAEALARVEAFLARSTRNLLVVEDDEIERTRLVELLGTGDDVTVAAAATSDAALAALAASDFDCVVLDLKLPAMSGMRCSTQVKADESPPRAARSSSTRPRT